MVEVDIFWSYGIGAGFAVAATRQIARGAVPPVPGFPRWFTPYLTVTVLYLALMFAPSGVYLLWQFPDWETMQLARTHASLPAWLVTAFAFTNVSQGVLGFWVTQRLILSGRRYLAFLQLWVAYLGMFFILVHGWDGRGYQRFFSADRAVFESWPQSPSFGDALGRAGEWVTSPVALTLVAMSVIVVVMLWIIARWAREGHVLAATANPPGAGRVISAVLATVFVAALGSAIVASVLIHLTGWWIGVPVAALVVWLAVLRPSTGVAYKLFGLLRLEDGNDPLPTPAAAVAVGSRG